MRLIPVYFSSPGHPWVQSHGRFTLHLAPATSPERTGQASPLPDPNPSRDDLLVLDRTDDLEVHSASVSLECDISASESG